MIGEALAAGRAMRHGTRNPIEQAEANGNELRQAAGYSRNPAPNRPSRTAARTHTRTHFLAARAQNPCKSHGPGRFRTCDLGIKSPAEQAANPLQEIETGCKSPEFMRCNELQQIALCRDKPVRASVRARRPRLWPRTRRRCRGSFRRVTSDDLLWDVRRRPQVAATSHF
jgi:hypothetical protein